MRTSFNEGEKNDCEEYRYDDHGNKILDISYYGDYSSFSTEYIYDDRDRLIEERHFINDQQSGMQTYEYDDRDNLTQRISYSENREIERWVYTYNDSGNMTTETKYVRGAEKYRYEYVYGADGAIEKMIGVEGGETWEQTMRYEKKQLPALQAAKLVEEQNLPGLKSGLWLAVTPDGSRYILMTVGEQWAICPADDLR